MSSMNAPEVSTGRRGELNLTPFLNFSGAQYGKAEEAIRFYVSLFPDSTVEYLERHGEGHAVPAGELRRGAFILAGQRFMATESQGDEPSEFTQGFSLYVECRTSEELNRLFDALSKGGKVLMPPESHRFSQLFALLYDRFGVTWQLEIPRSRSP